ncbi:MAG: phospho-N-acetylmuramoyl-pentapeptide-transferase [Thermoanaerobaculum sp.]|nr:phospho-N-acetylmuramoyl-pentapeptide-transferase [Thermoanaerobaculum sp.]MDW7968284.1 phospho-N-acetylmuramoyl-pentapeptide-transferase [Thermoanaerobaculum sp.]
MLYLLAWQLRDLWSPFNVFRYITFRSALAVVTALLVGLWLGPRLIDRLRRLAIRQAVREEGPASHRAKSGTPTMGGLLILFSVTVAALLFADPTEPWVWVAFGTTLAFGGIGFLDDWLKVKRGKNLGLRAWEKMALQLAAGLTAAGMVRLVAGHATHGGMLYVPFFKNVQLDLGWWYIPFAAMVLVACSNAVNLTDGLDGLAIGSSLLASGTFAVFCYVAGHARIAQYLQVPAVAGAGEVAVFCAALVGAGLAFLWFNCHPAQVFMGDVGSLSLGAAIGIAAVIAKQELALAIVGGLFVAEAASVILQVASFQLRGKRVFRMSPLHHHFELSGWAETQVVVRFWIVAAMCALAGLATLKLR